MKEIYEKPIAELEKFEEMDVLTVSGTDDNPTPWPFG